MNNSMTDVLLFNQYFTSKKNSPQQIFATLPINLLYLASYIRKKGIVCKIFDLGAFDEKNIILEHNRIRCGLSDEKIIQIIREHNPKIIGLGCMYSRHYIDVITLARLIKKINPMIKVILGGNHATAFSETVLKEPSIDFVVRGEGEITFYELCCQILSGDNDFQKIKGISYRDANADVIKTNNRELIKNLDELPVDYTTVDVKSYAHLSFTQPFHMRYPSLGIITSRGCPGDCIYCTVKTVWGRTWRPKSAKATVDELELLYRDYGIREFSLLDDSVSLDKKRWLDICDQIIKRKLHIRWTTPNGIAHWTLDKTILKTMKNAGCYRITFGIESGNPQTRKFLGKPFPLAQAKEMIQYANSIGMWTISTNILGFPYETKNAMMDTIRFAKQSGTDFATFFLLAPHVTSDVYAYFKKEGLLDFDYIFKDNVFDEDKYDAMNNILDDGGTPTKYFRPEELKKIQLEAYRSFIIYRALTFLNPLRLLSKIRSLEDLKYTAKLLLLGLRMLVNSFYKKTTKALLYSRD